MTRADRLRALLPVCVAGLLMLVVYDRPAPLPDAAEYLDLTETLRVSGRFEYSRHTALCPYRRTPGYPFASALLSWPLANLLALYGLTLTMIGLARRWGGTGRAVPLLIAASPGLIALTTMALTEVLFTALLWAAVAVLLRARSNLRGRRAGKQAAAGPGALSMPSIGVPAIDRAQAEGAGATIAHVPPIVAQRGSLANEGAQSSVQCARPSLHALGPVRSAVWLAGLAGLLLSCAALVRPVGLLLVLPLGPFLIVGGATARRSRALAMLALLIGAALLPAAWAVRNYTRGGELGITSISGWNLLLYKAGAYQAHRQGRPLLDVRAELEAAHQARCSVEAGPFARSALAGVMARERIAADPLGFARWGVRSVPLFFMPDISPLLERLELTRGNRGTYDVLRRDGAIAALRFYLEGNPLAGALTLVYVLIFLGIGLCALRGFVLALWGGQYELVALTVLLTGYFIGVSIGGLDWRFRMPLAPLYFVLATRGWAGASTLGAGGAPSAD